MFHLEHELKQMAIVDELVKTKAGKHRTKNDNETCPQKRKIEQDTKDRSYWQEANIARLRIENSNFARFLDRLLDE